MPQCTAKAKGTQLRCQHMTSAGKTVCHIHGGKTPVSIGLPQTTHGRYSKHLPQRLQERYEASLDDSELLNRRAEIAVLDARIGDLLKRVDSGESGRLWYELMDSWQSLQAKRTPENAVRHQQAIERGREDYAAWSEITDIFKVRDKLASSESKRLVEMQTMMDTQEALTVVRYLVDSVQRHVHDVEDRIAVAADLSQFIRGRIAGRVRPDGGDRE
jgi:hypothetical protein